jgi:hypothetical protein
MEGTFHLRSSQTPAIEPQPGGESRLAACGCHHNLARD